MTIKNLSQPDDEAQTLSLEAREFLQAACANFDRDIQIMKSRARSGEMIDLKKLDLFEHVYRSFSDELQRLTRGDDAPALSSAKHRGH